MGAEKRSSYTPEQLIDGVTGAIDSNDDGLVDVLLARLRARSEPDYTPITPTVDTTTQQNRSDAEPTVG